MRILVLAPQWPDPPRQGAAIRNLQIALYLAERHRVTLLTFATGGAPLEKERLTQACEHVEILPLPRRTTSQRLQTLATSPLPDMAWRLYSPQMLARAHELHNAHPFDAIHIEGIEMAPYALHLLSTQHSALSTAYDAHNAEYLLQRRAFTTDLHEPRRLPHALYSLMQWWRLRRYEREVCLTSKHVLAVSEADARALSALSPRLSRRITVLPNGVDPEYWSPGSVLPTREIPPGTEALVFDGSMDFRPNVDAARWMVDEVWPLIRQEKPGARLYIVGRNPSPDVRALAEQPGVHVTGEVDDTRNWVAAATVYVVPMRMGGGVRLKVLQAMAMERAIVSTPMGAEGIDVRHGHEMLLAGSASEFARATLSLLSDPERRVQLGWVARRLAVERYAWEKLLPTLDNIYPHHV